MKIAFIGYQKQQRYTVGTQGDEDKTLIDFLSSKGLDIDQVIWNDPAIDWTKYDKAILKSPWDYHEQFTEFNIWLDKLESLGIELFNPHSIVKWNSDKHYLKEIEDSGFDVIPSSFIEKGSETQLNNFFKLFNTQKLVIKPCVSASAKHTLIVDSKSVTERQLQLQHFLLKESFMVQPFVEQIVDGELSFIFFGNQYSHCVLKLPKAGDFRVQHFHGGTIRKYQPDSALIKTAKIYVSKFADGCLYARVDGLVINNRFKLMELELIEPYLFLDSGTNAYELYYDAFINLVRENT